MNFVKRSVDRFSPLFARCVNDLVPHLFTVKIFVDNFPSRVCSTRNSP